MNSLVIAKRPHGELSVLTWVPVGDDGVSVGLNASDEESITVLAAARTKLPLQFIATGRTQRAERNELGNIEYHETTHSGSGWTATTPFLLYLQWLRDFYGPGPELHLILGLYSVQCSDHLKAEAARLRIQPYFIPARFTNEIQPLDGYIFGVLKAMRRRMFHRFTEVVNGTVRKPDAVEFMVRAWEEVNENVIRKVWGIYEEPADDTGPTNDDLFMDDPDEAE
jgi:hypothetical protein